MISIKTIDEVSGLDLYSVISREVKLKKSGYGYSGLCPFHDEKTPSFHIHPTKNIWKCFGGCNVGGVGPVSFIMKYHSVEWIEAIKLLANQHNITIEEDDDRSNAQRVKEKQQQEYYWRINMMALNFFTQAAKDVENIDWRVKEELVEQFGIAYAPDSWDGLAKFMKKEKVPVQDLETIGLVKKGKTKNYDTYRHRLIFPIYNWKRELIGFGGRRIDDPPSKLQSDTEPPKYINPLDSFIYNKSSEVYGIHIARDYIIRTRTVHLVEGYVDVIACHGADLCNTVSPCGTSLTTGQITLLKRWAEAFRLFYDNDDAGIKAATRSVELLVQENITDIEVIFTPDGINDPDQFVNAPPQKEDTGEPWELADYVAMNSEDGILWYCRRLLDGNFTVSQRVETLGKVERFLSNLGNPTMIKEYLREVKEIFPSINVSESFRNISMLQETQNDDAKKHNLSDKYLLSENLTKDQREELGKFGFFIHGHCYYERVDSKDGEVFKPFSNFVMEIKHHIFSMNNPKRVLKFYNGRSAIIQEVDTGSITSLQKFKEFVESLGNFVFWGSPVIHTKIKLRYYMAEKSAKSLAILGWQPREKIFSFSNAVITADGEIVRCNEDGIVEIKDRTYYIPAGNHANLEDDMAFSNQRKFVFKDNPQVTFAAWAKLFCDVYKKPGIFYLPFAIAALFSDVAFTAAKGFPLPFLFGPPSSGKGSLIKSLQSLWGEPQTPMKLLGKSTGKAQISVLAQFINGLYLFEEYPKNPTEDIIEFLKGIWDRYGYTRKTKDYSFDTDNVPITSACMLTGNNYPSQDDPLLTRLLVYEFAELKREDITQDQKDNFKMLADMEEAGITPATLEILKLRRKFVKEFTTQLATSEKIMSKAFEKIPGLEQRMIINMSILHASAILAAGELELPFDEHQWINIAQEVMVKQNDKRMVSGEAAKFWHVILWMLRNGKITENEIDVDSQYVYLRMNAVHTEYMAAYNFIYREQGMAFSQLRDKLLSQYYDAFAGAKAGHRFGPTGKNTSCHQFYVEKIGIEDLPDVFYHMQAARERKLRMAGNQEQSTTQENNAEKEDEKLPEGLPF